MDVRDYIGFVVSEGELFAAAAEQGDLAVDIPPCPGWDMRDLVRHLGLIHLWAAEHVAFPREDPSFGVELDQLADSWPDLAGAWPADADLISWYRQTHANVVRVLQAAPADVDAFTFLPAPSPLAMWARRQASEIAIHRFDAEVSRDIPSHYDPMFATDMLDELMSGFTPRRRSLDIDGPRTVHVHAEDTDEHWYVSLTSDRTETARTGDQADLTVSGTAAQLYLLLWNRAPDSTVTMSGDTDLMGLWHGRFRVRWS